jgi:uncharacterized membrane protein YeaQ/YmgE (transglycosylase-associated protein family)
VTVEARLAFILFFFLVWCVLGVIPWTVAAVMTRGRGALLGLPLALAGAAAAGVFVPLVGLRDTTGFFLSLPAALVGGAVASVAGIAVSRRLSGLRDAAEVETPRPRR